MLTFSRFRELCNSMNCGERTVEFWEGMDPGLAGCVSIFEFDPDAVALLIRLRSRMISYADCVDSEGNKLDSEVLFGRLTFLIKTSRPGAMDKTEFRAAVKPLGLRAEEADRAFTYLDHHGGRNPPAMVTVSDIAWLGSMDQLVDVRAVLVEDEDKLGQAEYLRTMTWKMGGGSRARSQRNADWQSLWRSKQRAESEPPKEHSTADEASPIARREAPDSEPEQQHHDLSFVDGRVAIPDTWRSESPTDAEGFRAEPPRFRAEPSDSAPGSTTSPTGHGAMRDGVGVLEAAQHDGGEHFDDDDDDDDEETF